MTKMTCVLVSLCLILFPSCSLFVTSTQSVAVQSSDAGAEIYADGREIGKGTATVQLKRNESHAFMAKTADGRAGTAVVGRSMSTTAVLDIVGGCLFLIPFIGLAAPGAWDLDATTIMIPVPTK